MSFKKFLNGYELTSSCGGIIYSIYNMTAPTETEHKRF